MVDTVLQNKLISSLSNSKWQSLGPADLDIGYAALTSAEKQTIIDSIKAGDNAAKDLIKQKLSTAIQAYATQQAAAYMAQGSIPLAELGNLV